jgi:hypothetical protein
MKKRKNSSLILIVGLISILMLLYVCYLLYKKYTHNYTQPKTEIDLHTTINLDNTKKYNEQRLLDRTEEPGFVYDNRVYDDRLVYPDKKVGLMPINLKTRGYPADYQQIGILTNENNPTDIKPMYGRQTYTGSDLWNYYTSTDSDLALKIPINSENDKCTSELGCKEIYDNSSLDVNNNKYKFTKYETDEFRYIPYV